jgi:hypothetical protein
MKENEAPEKIYISTNSQDGTYYISNQYKRLIEYTRTDAFIERVETYLKEQFEKDVSVLASGMDYKVEGNIIYPDKRMLTWGPFYFHSRDKAIEKTEEILQNITEWCNEKDPSLSIKPYAFSVCANPMSDRNQMILIEYELQAHI